MLQILNNWRKMDMTILQVNEREMTLSGQSSSNTTKKATTAKARQKPIDNEWFEVKPHTIDRKLFEKPRKDNYQEECRRTILKAFDVIEHKPEYGRDFETLMPTAVTSGTGEKLLQIAQDFNGHTANWIEQALEWAQRIANGESWRALCNYQDTANYFRFVEWTPRHCRIIGGSTRYKHLFQNGNFARPTSVSLDILTIEGYHECTIPLVVRYK